MKTIKDLEKDTVGEVEGGVFTFLGIPERFLAGKQERCLHYAEEECPLVHIVQTRRQEKEKESQDLEEKKETKKEPKLSSLQMWSLRVKQKFMLGSGQSLVDQNYICQLKMVLSRTEYMRALEKHFLLNQLFRFAGWVCMLELARIRKENKEEIRELDIRKEAFGLMLRTSQKHYSVKDNSETTVNGIHCLHPRLEKGVAKQIYGTSNIPILSNKDLVTVMLLT